MVGRFSFTVHLTGEEGLTGRGQLVANQPVTERAGGNAEAKGPWTI